MAKADFLKEKAEVFLENAEHNFSRQKWFAVAFNLEQALQLYLKYYLYLKIKRFPKTHSLRELLEGIGKTYKKEKEIKKIIKKNANIISDLDQAYITARYLPVEYFPEQVEGMRNFAFKIIKFLKRL